MKIDGRVYNMCLSRFIVETSRYDSTRTKKGWTFAIGVKHCVGSVHPRECIDEACVDRRGIDAIHRPKLSQVIWGPCLHSL